MAENYYQSALTGPQLDAALKNLTAITVLSQPADCTVEEGQSAVFRVTAMGTGLQYQWQYRLDDQWYNCTLGTPNAPTYAVTATQARSTYAYRCCITDSAGSIFNTDEAVIRLHAPLRLADEPVDRTVCLGQIAQFRVTARGEGLQYQWQYNMGDTWRVTTMEGNTTDTLTVEGKISRSGYQYRCIVTDSALNTVTSRAATLTVNAFAQPEQHSFTVNAGDRLGLFAATGISDRLYGLLSCDAGYGCNALYLLDVSAPGITAARASLCENTLSPVMDWSSDYSDYLLTAPAHADLRCSFIPM